MKTKEELRLLIEEIDDASKGNVLNEDQAGYNIDYSGFEIIDSELTPKQNYELHIAIKQGEDGDVYSWDDFMSLTNGWKSK